MARDLHADPVSGLERQKPGGYVVHTPRGSCARAA